MTDDSGSRSRVPVLLMVIGLLLVIITVASLLSPNVVRIR